MYQNTAAIIRHDLNAFVEEAAKSDEHLFGNKILPTYSTNARAGIYPRIEIASGELLKKDSTLRAPTGTYNETTRKFKTATYECLDRGLEERIDDVLVKDYDKFFDVEVLTSKLIMRTLKMDYESRVFGVLQGSGNTSTITARAADYRSTALGTTQWGQEAEIAEWDFAKVLMDAIKSMTKLGETPNTLVLSSTQWNYIRRLSKLNTFLYGNLGSGVGYKLINDTDIGKAFGIKNVYITHSYVDGAGRMSSSTSLSAMWDKQKAWLGNVQGGEISGGGFGRTFVWSKDGGLFNTETYRSEPRRGDMIRVRHHTSELVVNGNAGCLIDFGSGNTWTD
jgi:hypothetical protein